MLGFIGTGNMNGAILRGVLGAGLIESHDVYVTRSNADAGRELARALGINYVESNARLAATLSDGDVIIVGVKPYAILDILRELSDDAVGKVIVSVAAGISLSQLESALPSGVAVVRAMPNVNSQIGAGMTALVANSATSEDELAAVETIFDSVGKTVRLAEKDFAAYSAIAGCSPAWTYTYIDALARGAVAAGLPLAQAREIAAQAVLGSAQLVLENDGEKTPSELVDQVTSPGGTTIAGLIAMEKSGFSNAVIDGVRGAIARDRELGE